MGVEFPSFPFLKLLGSLTFRFPLLLSFFLCYSLAVLGFFLPPFHKVSYQSRLTSYFSLLSTTLVYLLYRVSFIASHLLPSLCFWPTPLMPDRVENMPHDGAVDTPRSETPVSESGEDRDRQITTLARSLSQISQQNSLRAANEATEGVNTFLDSSDPELDPNSDQFKSRKWVKNIIQMTSRDPDRYPRRTTGVSFRNLNVFGYGTAADYQMDFANFWLKGAGWFRSAFGLQKKVRIDILRDFEGIVHSGEMLVVLGRPGRYVNRHPPHKGRITNDQQRMLYPPQNHRRRDPWPLSGQG
jgi:hypothetical protein